MNKPATLLTVITLLTTSPIAIAQTKAELVWSKKPAEIYNGKTCEISTSQDSFPCAQLAITGLDEPKGFINFHFNYDSSSGLTFFATQHDAVKNGIITTYRVRGLSYRSADRTSASMESDGVCQLTRKAIGKPSVLCSTESNDISLIISGSF
jgi:hypothetical protein